MYVCMYVCMYIIDVCMLIRPTGESGCNHLVRNVYLHLSIVAYHDIFFPNYWRCSQPYRIQPFHFVLGSSVNKVYIIV